VAVAHLVITCRGRAIKPVPLGDGIYACRVVIEMDAGGVWRTISDTVVLFWPEPVPKIDKAE
jgi:hypothetical protein